ncbi:MAG: histidine kinase dimerization/phosphoacceptor domain -containing protein [Candidatus Eremiobacterota bacterium]
MKANKKSSKKKSSDHIRDEKSPEELLFIQRNLSLFLASTSDLKEAFYKILEVICQTDCIDSGGIYIVDRRTEDLNLIVHRGLSPEFINTIYYAKGNILHNSPIKKRVPVYTHAGNYEVFKEVMVSEGLHAICMIPVLYGEQLIALMNLASHTYDDIPHNTRNTIETIAMQIGSVIIRLRHDSLVQESQQNLQIFFDTIDDILVISDASGNIIHFNPAAEKISGYSRDELTGMSVYNIFAETEAVNKIFSHISLSDKKIGNFHLITGEGTFIPVETKIAKGTWDNQDAIFSISRDITERKRTEEELSIYRTQLEKLVEERTVELKTILEEKEILLKEIHHRVKNNLQIISSLIYLQISSIEDDTIADILKDSQNRIKSIGLVHEKLYQSENFARIDFKRYIYDLSSYLFSSYHIDVNIIKLNIKVRDIYLNINKAIPCGLIINELVTNALKYAFPAGRKGEISIKFHQTNGKKLILEIGDNGAGLPEDINIETSTSLGLKLVVNLAKQIDGDLYIERETGTIFKIIFPS